MSDAVKFWMQAIVAGIGALTAALPSVYPEGLPEWAKTTMLIGGVVVAVLGSLKAGQTFKTIRAVDVDGDGVADELVVDISKKPEEK